jgi:ketol-acid reductoisomerase
MKKIDTDVIGTSYGDGNSVDNAKLIHVNKVLREHPVEIVGARLRESMTAMKPII